MSSPSNVDISIVTAMVAACHTQAVGSRKIQKKNAVSSTVLYMNSRSILLAFEVRCALQERQEGVVVRDKRSSGSRWFCTGPEVVSWNFPRMTEAIDGSWCKLERSAPEVKLHVPSFQGKLRLCVCARTCVCSIRHITTLWPGEVTESHRHACVYC